MGLVPGETLGDKTPVGQRTGTSVRIGLQLMDRLLDLQAVGWSHHDVKGNNALVDFKHWATPGNSLSSAALDLARTTCRRAERRVVAVCERKDYVNPESIRYLNRLSDVLWLFARFMETKNTQMG